MDYESLSLHNGGYALYMRDDKMYIDAIDLYVLLGDTEVLWVMLPSTWEPPSADYET